MDLKKDNTLITEPERVSEFDKPRRQQLADGAIVEYWTMGPPESDAFVFLHGIGGCAKDWFSLMNQLAPKYRTIAWNAPGYGASTNLASDTPSVSEYVGRLAHVLDALSLQRITLVAHSWGALIAASFFQRHASRIKSLALVSPSIGLSHVPVAERAAIVVQRVDLLNSLGVDGWIKDSAPRLVATTAPKSLVEETARPNPALQMRGITQATHALATGDPIAALQDVEKPFLVVYGSDDQITPAEFGVRFKTQTAAARLEIIPACGHLPFAEKPERIQSLLESFWARNITGNEPTERDNE